MIVKNESPVIRRCLATVKPLVDHWVVVDTGSSDGTQDTIREFMHGVPGQLHERPWRNFGHNRNEALALARPHADYLLFIDADEMLAVPPGFEWPALNNTGYRFNCVFGSTHYQRNALVAARTPWRWCGVIHEYLDSTEPHHWQLLDGPQIVVSHDGARARDPTTYLRDIAVLKQALLDEPSNARYAFYLAQSHKDAGQWAASREAYLHRAAMGGWEEERWCAQFRAALLGENLGLAPEQVRSGYLEAYQARPSRAEPLYELARYHRHRNEFSLALLFASQAAAIPLSSDILFVDASVYQWRALDELAVAASFLPEQRARGRCAMQTLLAQALYPQSEAARMLGNQVFYQL